MPSFSERQGLVSAKVIQIESMNYRLVVGIWNTIYRHLIISLSPSSDSSFRRIAYNVWLAVCDEHWRMPEEQTIKWLSASNFFDLIKRKCADFRWNQYYDLLEALLEHHSNGGRKDEFRKQLNMVLEKEMSGYRLIGDQVTPIIEKYEVEAIEEAISQSKPYSQHIQTALKLLSKRENPDYRNSIKESISAVESICFTLSGSKKFEDALKTLQKKLNFHPALQGAFTKLYGYTSDGDGIRHALLEDGVNVGYEEAHFFLIACSAFVNFISSKTADT